MKKILFLFIILGILLFAGYRWVEHEAYKGTVSGSNIAKEFEVKEGEGSTEVGQHLQQAGLVKSKYIFYYYVWKTKTDSKIQVGKYELAPNMTMGEMVSKFTSGEIIPQIVKVTIPEGFTNKKIIERIREKKPELADDFEKVVSCRCIGQALCGCDKMSTQFPFLLELPKGVDLEGYLFPDTYFIEKEDTAETLVAKFLNNFTKQVDQELQARMKEQGRSLHQTVTMASIIEREVNTQEAREIVADIFWKRYNDNHPLQSDATLSYILGVDKMKYYNEEIKDDSPYNTYAHTGLPPGPVANPGLASVRAAVNPQKTDYYFFLTDPNTGEMVYSITHDEHVENKQKHGL